MIIATLRKPLLLGTGWLCVGLGALGVIMPLFPTTPFLLVAVWAFSKSSPELAEKIRNHPVVGPYIRDWQDHRVIPLKAKLFAVGMMAAMLAYLEFVAHAPGWMVVGAGALFLGVAVYIVTRSSQAPA